MSLCLFIGTASAQRVVTDLDQLSNDKKYFIQSARCFLMYSTYNPTKLSTSTGETVGSVTQNFEDVNQQFKIEEVNEKYYLKSVGANKYVNSSGVLSDTKDANLTLENVGGDYQWKLCLGGNGLNSQEPGQWAEGIVVNSWTTTDAGNCYRIIEITEEPLVGEPLVENGKLYRIKNRCTNLGVDVSENANVGDGHGAYLGSTYIVLRNIPAGLGANFEGDKRDIHCATTSKADAGCIWMFEGSDSDGWAIKNMNNGMYIDDKRSDETKDNAWRYVKFVEGIENAARFIISETGNYVTFYDPDYNNGTDNYLHASGAGLQVYTAGSTASHWTIEPATELEVTVSSADYASIYLPFDVTLPEGENLKAYAVTSTKGGYAKLEKMTTGIPANNGAILEGAGTHTLNIEEATSDWDGNLLLGSNVNTYVEGDAFVLANGENGVGLYKAALNKGENGADGDTHFLNNANKAYLSVSSTQGANMLRFDFGGETTGVDAVEVENNVKTIYDLSGRKVSNMSAPGLYIVNGKKVLVK